MGTHLITGRAATAHINSEDLAALNAAIVGAGNYVAAEYGSKLAATLTTTNRVHIADGLLLMQGRQVIVEAGGVDLTIDNGTQGQGRNDLVVARYDKSSAGIESCALKVVKGTPTSGTPADPAIVGGNTLTGGAAVSEVALYRIALNGITPSDPVKLITDLVPSKVAWDSICRVKLGIWDVVKRPDGVSICTARISLSLDISISYTNNVKFGQIPSYTYPPGLFATPPNVQFFIEPNDHMMWQASHNPGTAQATPPLRMLTFNPGIVPVVINISAEG